MILFSFFCLLFHPQYWELFIFMGILVLDAICAVQQIQIQHYVCGLLVCGSLLLWLCAVFIDVKVNAFSRTPAEGLRVIGIEEE